MVWDRNSIALRDKRKLGKKGKGVSLFKRRMEYIREQKVERIRNGMEKEWEKLGIMRDNED